MKKRLKYRLIQYLVKNLLKAVTEDDILVVSNHDWLYRKRALTKEEVISLEEECASFKKSILWRLLRNEVTFLANQTMFEKQQTNDDMLFGKAMLYNLSLIEKFINRVA